MKHRKNKKKAERRDVNEILPLVADGGTATEMCFMETHF